MRPFSTMYDIPSNGVPYPIFLCEFMKTYSTCQISLSHFYHFIIIQFGMVFSATWMITSAFLFSVIHILFMRSKPKMFWIHTCGIITRMTYFHILWNFTMNKLPRYNVSAFILLAISDITVTGATFSTLPLPTQIIVSSDGNFRPKGIFELFGGIIGSRHGLTPVTQSPVVSTNAGNLFPLIVA